MKGIYILFSGGYDSSYLTNRVLMDLKSKNDKESEVNLISLDATFLASKAEREKQAREKLLNYWKAKFYDQKINYYELKIDVTKFSINSCKTGLSQPQFWLSSLVSTIDYTRYEEIDVMMSYISGDQAIVYHHEIEKIILHTSNLAYTAFASMPFEILKKPKVNVLFPLSMACKEYIINHLIIDDEFVFENCTSCENQKDDNCGECVPCKCLRSTLINLINDKSTSPEVKYVCSIKLKEFETEVPSWDKVESKAEDDKLILNDEK